jgi:hypothetical protein
MPLARLPAAAAAVGTKPLQADGELLPLAVLSTVNNWSLLLPLLPLLPPAPPLLLLSIFYSLPSKVESV